MAGEAEASQEWVPSSVAEARGCTCAYLSASQQDDNGVEAEPDVPICKEWKVRSVVKQPRVDSEPKAGRRRARAAVHEETEDEQPSEASGESLRWQGRV